MKSVKILIIVIMIILFSLLCTTISNAKTAIVDTDTLNLRKEASTDSAVLKLLNIGEKLEVIEETGDWVKVKISGVTGFVHKDYIKIQEDKEEVKQEEKEEVKEEQPENQVKEEVSNNELQENTTIIEDDPVVEETSGEKTIKKDSKVYILPLINSNTISELKTDDKVIVIDETNNWAYVQTEEVNGWIIKSILEELKTSDNEVDNNKEDDNKDENNNKEDVENKNDENKDNDNNKQEENKENEIKETAIKEKMMYVNYHSIYVRKGPGTNYDVVDSLILNSGVIVTAESGEWYKVKVDGKEGYIAKRLLSNTKTETEETSRSAEERIEEEIEETNQVEVNTSKGEQIVNYAKQYLGCKYVYGGSGPSTFDCSGFTMYVYKHFGISLSHSARAQSKNGSYVAKSDLQPGDLVFFKDYETMNGIGHCGIYIGDGNFIHASSGTGYCVKISTLLSGSYLARYETARRLI